MTASRSPDPRLDLEPAPLSARIWLFALVVALPLAIMSFVAWSMLTTDDPVNLIADSIRITWMAMIGSVVLLLAIWWVIDRMLRRHRIVLDADGIEVATTFYRRRLALAQLDLADARVVDLDERTEFKPMLKTNGTALPGFRSGWFRLRNRRKALVAMNAGPRVLWLPTRSDHDLLLQPRQPQALLERLRAMAGDTHRG